MSRYGVVEGNHIDATDDVAGTWYVVDRAGSIVDRRGRGYGTRAEALVGLSDDLDLRGDLEIMGTAEIADWLGVTQTTVHSWRRRHHDFPTPWRILATGPIWLLHDIAHWAARPRRAGRPHKDGRF